LKNEDAILPRIYTIHDASSMLAQISEWVEEEDDWKGLLTRLEFCLLTSRIPALGLSAIQIGVPARCFIAKIHGRIYPFINPVITRSYGSYLGEEEGCLSIPGEVCYVRRWGMVDVKPLQWTGKESQIATFNGLDARIIQHEMDHLDGRLMTSRKDPS
jgi:peptide deformylase